MFYFFQVLKHSFPKQRADFICLPESVEYFQGRLTMVLEIDFSGYKLANTETYHFLLNHNSHDILKIHSENSDVSMFLYVGCTFHFRYLFPVPPGKQLKICYRNILRVLSFCSSCVLFTANSDYASQFLPQNFKTQEKTFIIQHLISRQHLISVRIQNALEERQLTSIHF